MDWLLFGILAALGIALMGLLKLWKMYSDKCKEAEQWYNMISVARDIERRRWEAIRNGGITYEDNEFKIGENHEQ